MKSLKKSPDSEVLSSVVFQLLHIISCNEKMIPKIMAIDIFNALTMNLENHSGLENVAEWCCRLTHQLLKYDGIGNTERFSVSSKMRSAGLCEMVPSAVQRQAISKVVAHVGCLAIGDLAVDKNNQTRLTSANACDAVVAALKRHHDSRDVVISSCYAMHFLALTQSNIGWMGVNGACDAVTVALIKHNSPESEDVAVNALNALGSLAFKDEGNQIKLHTCGGCSAVVAVMRTHANCPEVCGAACRAIHHLCAENLNVKDLGVKGACTHVVKALKTHSSYPEVVTQAFYAIHSLAVKVIILNP
jgi:hypothetical protein